MAIDERFCIKKKFSSLEILHSFNASEHRIYSVRAPALLQEEQKEGPNWKFIPTLRAYTSSSSFSPFENS